MPPVLTDAQKNTIINYAKEYSDELNTELVNENGKRIAPEETIILCLNKYEDQEMDKKYDKLKRTKESLVDRIKTTKENIEVLSSILTSLSFSDDERDIAEIRQELYEHGFIKKSGVKFAYFFYSNTFVK